MREAQVRSGMPAWLVWVLIVITAGLFTPIWYLANKGRMNAYYDKTISTSIKNRIRMPNVLLILYLACYVVFIVAMAITWKAGITSGSYTLFLYIFVAIAWPCSWFVITHRAADSINANFLWGLFWSVIGLLVAFTIYKIAALYEMPKILTESGNYWLVCVGAIVLLAMAQIGSLAPVYFQYKMNRTPGMYV